MERELWKALYLLAQKLDEPWEWLAVLDGRCCEVYFWAVVHDRPTSWAADPAQWPSDLRPGYCSPKARSVGDYEVLRPWN